METNKLDLSLPLHKLASNPQFQRECSEFVGREVIHCVSSLVDALAKVMEEPSMRDYYDDLMALSCGRPDYEQAALEHYEEWVRTDKPKKKEKLEAKELLESDPEQYCQDNNLDPENLEIYEHWAVSKWLGRKLEEQGEIVVFNFFDFQAIWGRATTGQSISMDGVIERIYLDTQKPKP